MAGPTTVRVDGLRELLRATDAAGKDTKKLVRDRFRKIAEPVREGATARFLTDVSPNPARTRYGISVRRSGIISVEQRKRRTANEAMRRPIFGALQMKYALVPALESEEDAVVEAFDEALSDLARDWGSGG